MELKIISQSVAEHLGENAEASENWRKRVERLGMIILLTSGSMFILLMTAAAICGAISEMFGLRMEDFRFDLIFPLVSAIALPFFFVGIGMKFYPAIIKELSRNRSKRLAPPPAETTKKLSSGTPAESIGSITEHTTEFLGMSEARNTAPKPHEDMKA
jgi:hypothetical protein